MTLYIFDMGGVVALDTDVFPTLSEHLKLTPEFFFEVTGPGLALLMDGLITAKEFWANFSAKTGITVQEELFVKYFKPRLDRVMTAFIQMLKKESRVVCGTNTMDPHYDYLKPRGYYDIFDAVYASNKIGVSKPRPEFYRYILDAEGVEPQHTVFIDDFEENVRAAEALGISSILFKNAVGLRSAIEKMKR
jgi:HAD superfamily hydrolase (TIGR01509 family)